MSELTLYFIPDKKAIDNHHLTNCLLLQGQVTELERALGHLDALEASRNVLRVEYQTQTGGDSMLSMDSVAAKGTPPGKWSGSGEKQAGTRSAISQNTMAAKAPRKQRMSKEDLEAPTDIGSNTPGPKRRGPGKKQKASAVKYRAPASDKTWSGRGRKPNWISGDADRYLVSNVRAINGGNPDAAEAANQTEA